jgi:transposase
VERWTTIRCLAAQGKGVRCIARTLKVHRETVRRALRDPGKPRYQRASRPNPELEGLRPVLTDWLFEKKLIGSVILERLSDPRSGYEYHGSPVTLYRYLRRLRAERLALEPHAVMRFETEPGEQGQFDWSPYTVRIGGELIPICLFDLILGFSRKRHFTWSLDHSQASVFEAIEKSLQHFGGAPRSLLVDRAREMVQDPSVTPVVWNSRFLELCGHYRMEPRACQARRGQTKGKVERPFFYVEQHLIKGRDWPDFEAFERDLAELEARWETQVNGTTQETPLARFERERTALLPLPATPFISSAECFHKVNHDCLVPYKGSRYSTPWTYAGKRVWLRSSQGRFVEIRSQAGEVIARHALAAKKGQSVINPAHYEGLRRRAGRTRAMVEAQILQRFPDCTWYCEAVATVYRDHPEYVLRGVVELSHVYPPEVMRAAFARQRAAGVFSLAFLRGLLQDQAPEDLPVVRMPEQLVLWSETGGADLSRYARVLEGVRGRG